MSEEEEEEEERRVPEPFRTIEDIADDVLHMPKDKEEDEED